MAICLSIVIPSCGLFDKELKQDQEIAVFRRQMLRVQDSLDNPKEKIIAYKSIIEQIEGNQYLITLRKKNNLLIEGNAYVYNEYLRKNNYKEAINYSNVIISLDSSSANGYYGRGCVYQIIDKDSLALNDYNKAIQLNSEFANAYYNRGVIYEEQEKFEQALVDYNKAIKFNSSDLTNAFNNRGNIYLAKESVDKAIEDYSKAISIDTTNVKALCNRACAYVLKKEFDKALIDCNRAIEMDSTNVNAYIKRAYVYEEKKEYSEAVDDYKKIIVLDPNDELNTHDIARQAIRKLRPLINKKD